ncbi:hypothetical protein N7452_009973 [Penicillium brevicompactum]|uniref:Uncharacterized protein n=1 Tax=Penicillium brevicompactum TaxID=5074 RepID=A0A9W9UB51_PENBR|nr:hypothetical protein N7452_009973 [Penicillium brevicompactum]
MMSLDPMSQFVDASRALEEHEWIADLYQRFSVDDDPNDWSFQHSIESSAGTHSTPIRTGGVMNSHDLEQVVKAITCPVSATLCQDQHPLATTNDISVNRTRVYDHGRTRGQKQK